MFNKKGFTLIEIIISLTLIVIIGGVILFNIKTNNDKSLQDKRNKIISDVKNAANVYYSSNKEIQNKMKNNYGYYVVNVNELQELGLLKDNIVDPIENKDIKLVSYGENSEYRDYSRAVIMHSEFKGDEESKIGLIDVIYPYQYASEKEEEYLVADDMFFEWTEEANCDSISLDIQEQYKNPTSLIKLSKDYNFENDDGSNNCKVEDNAINGVLTKCKENYTYKKCIEKYDVTHNALNLEVEYFSNDKSIGAREFNFFDKYESNIKFYDGITCNGTEITDYDKWYKNATACIENISKNRNIDREFYVNSQKENFNNSYFLYETGKYKIEESFKAYNINSDSDIPLYEGSKVYKDLKIDNTFPTVEFNYDSNNPKIIIKDLDSKIKEYYVDDELKESNINKEQIEINVLKNNNYIVKVIDNADNINEQTINTDILYPIVDIIAVKDSFDEYELTLSHSKDLYKIDSINFKATMCYKNDCDSSDAISISKEINNFDDKSNNYSWKLNFMSDTSDSLILSNLINEFSKDIKFEDKSFDYLNNLKIKYDVKVNYFDGPQKESKLYNFYLSNGFSRSEDSIASFGRISTSSDNKNHYIMGMNNKGELLYYFARQATELTRDGYNHYIKVIQPKVINVNDFEYTTKSIVEVKNIGSRDSSGSFSIYASGYHYTPGSTISKSDAEVPIVHRWGIIDGKTIIKIGNVEEISLVNLSTEPFENYEGSYSQIDVNKNLYYHVNILSDENIVKIKKYIEYFDNINSYNNFNIVYNNFECDKREKCKDAVDEGPDGLIRYYYIINSKNYSYYPIKYDDPESGNWRDETWLYSFSYSLTPSVEIID